MNEKDFMVEKSNFNTNISGQVSAKSPSNIALVKYWGKTEPQIPTNPSISYTLTNSYTNTELHFEPKKSVKSQIQVFLSGEETPSFVPKIEKFFDRIKNYAPYIYNFDYIIKTENSFPHSSGIASSASGMSALSQCLIQIEEKLDFASENPNKRASFLARLGSGSACRSTYNGLIEWGKSEFVADSSNLYAVPLSQNIHPIYKTFRDTILLIHEGKKSVSSSVGHNLMNGHPYANERFKQANQNIGKLLKILQKDDLEEFGKLVEHEAMSLHAVMLTSHPPYILMQPNTVEALNRIWEFRNQTQLPLYFTLDAGANVHLLYPEKDAKNIEAFIHSDLIPLCQNNKAIFDFVNFD